jgi:hypothetical protein
MSGKKIGSRTMIHGPMMKWLDPVARAEYLRGRIQDLQHELGRALVAALWDNPGHPFLIQLDAHETYSYEHDAKILTAQATVLETVLQVLPCRLGMLEVWVYHRWAGVSQDVLSVCRAKESHDRNGGSTKLCKSSILIGRCSGRRMPRNRRPVVGEEWPMAVFLGIIFDLRLTLSGPEPIMQLQWTR